MYSTGTFYGNGLYHNVNLKLSMSVAFRAHIDSTDQQKCTKIVVVIFRGAAKLTNNRRLVAAAARDVRWNH